MKRQVIKGLVSALGVALLTTSAFAKEPVKIGALYSVTGGMSSIDAPSLRGAKLAAKLANKSGGVLDGRQIEIIAVDAKTDQKESVLGAKKLLSQGVVVGIGHSDPSFVLPSAPLFQKKKIPFITSGATLPTLPAMVGDYLFMVAYGDDGQAYATADFTKDVLHAKNIAVWTDNGMDFTKALSKFYKKKAKANGLNIVLEDFFMTGDKDYSAQVTRLENTSPKPDAIFVSAGPDEAGVIVKQIRQSGITAPILSGDGFDTDLIITVPGKKYASDIYYSTHTFRGDSRPEVVKFNEDYKKEYGIAPENAFAALGYDAVGLAIDAIKRANSADPKKIKGALDDADYQAVTGKISFKTATRVPKKPIAIIGVHNGEVKVEKTMMP